MINLVKMHLNTLRRRKHIYILGLIFFAFPILLVASQQALGAKVASETLTDFFTDQIGNSYIAMVVGVLAGLYYCRMESTGFIKNIASTQKKKANIAFSVMGAYTIITIFYVILGSLGGYITWEFLAPHTAVGNINTIFLFTLMSLFIDQVIICFSVMIGVVCKSNAGTAIINILMFTFVPSLVGMASAVIHIDLTKYMVWSDIGSIQVTYTSQWNSALIGGVIVLVTSCLLVNYYMNKKDIL